MLTHPTVTDSANYVVDYFNEHLSTFSDHLKEKAKAAARMPSPVDRLVNGMEVIFAVLLEEDTPDRETAIQALHTAAVEVASNGFHAKGDRAMTLVKYARYEAGEWTVGVPAPDTPAIDDTLATPV